jgi:hypothetical protein
MSKRSHTKAGQVTHERKVEISPLLSCCGLPSDAAWEPVSTGPFNQVFKVHTRDGVYALKWYGQGRGAAVRFLTEQAWYDLLKPLAQRHMPEAVVWQAARRCVLLKWVEGASLKAEDLTPAALADLLALVSALHRLRPAAVGRAFPPASGACFSLLDRLDSVGQGAEKTARQLTGLRGAKALAGRWEPAWQVVMSAVLKRAEKAGVDPRMVLPLNQRMLAAPDWGLHQALRTAEGRLVFFDFDGAGWEDPAWWLAGVFTRWEVALPLQHWNSLVPAAVRLLGVDSETVRRAALLLPASRFHQLCGAVERLVEMSPPAARPVALRQLETALTDLARAEWWLPV